MLQQPTQDDENSFISETQFCHNNALRIDLGAFQLDRNDFDYSEGPSSLVNETNCVHLPTNFNNNYTFINKNNLNDDDSNNNNNNINNNILRVGENLPEGFSIDELKPRHSLMNMFKEAKEKGTYLKVQAPMVRYSKLAFRLLCREYGCDVVYTPMIMSDCFHKSQKARDSDFTTHYYDSPLVVQFAANNPTDFSLACQLAAPYCDGIDLNCGCPQPYVMKESLGAALVTKPQKIFDMVHEANNKFISGMSRPIGVKIRLHPEDDTLEFRKTIELARQIEMAGASWVTVHGRTHKQRTKNTKVNPDGPKTIKQILNVPVMHNGDIFTLGDSDRFAKETGCDGVMSARGLLSNPALFSGYDYVPFECIQRYLQIAIQIGGVPFHILQHHIMFMLYSHHQFLSADVIEFSECTSVASILDFFEERGLQVY
ncbi:predicted protein [Naegleria gruberi]|uniref:Predicted protein n=1 Tax=Naegleria gruberi TaxID=5762 RepID=D2VPP8_NAEGR|nr:uncharacterized protein NAEGRDRAFT_70940 [Naegleria gruberi]EFC41241.1 predicted protein [Naegleria gruberi]|eukprot:XP_002673985.1 predicted protein [Naegleria gruberi strain NEG-M]